MKLLEFKMPLLALHKLRLRLWLRLWLKPRHSKSIPFSGVSSNGELLKYVNEVMQSITPYTPYHLHAQSVEYLRYTPRHMNMCINPLQAIRAWALLANMADGKTNTDLLNFVGKCETFFRPGLKI